MFTKFVGLRNAAAQKLSAAGEGNGSADDAMVSIAA